MTFFCDVIIRVSFKVSFPHLYVLEVWQSQMRLCYKRQYFFCARAIFCVLFSFVLLSAKITPELHFLKPLSRFPLFSKGILKLYVFTKRGARQIISYEAWGFSFSKSHIYAWWKKFVYYKVSVSLIWVCMSRVSSLLNNSRLGI